jgi:hypothetical protein
MLATKKNKALSAPKICRVPSLFFLEEANGGIIFGTLFFQSKGKGSF